MKLPANKQPVAYFCTEFGIDNDLPTYSGGLGVLAGDTINAAADLDIPMMGIGILFKGKSFIQHITGEGREEKRDSEFDHDTSFLRPTTINGKPLLISIPSGGDNVFAKAYQIRLGENTINYFLSTDVDGNPQDWISDMDALYRGGVESLLRQQILLGVGGVRLLNDLIIKPSIYHINEGRPSFAIWEIARNIAQEKNISFEDAWEEAQNKIVYTNHTLVSAGNLNFPKEAVLDQAKLFVEKNNINVDPEFLISKGLVDNSFDTTLYSLSISKKQSAVSKIHAKYAKKQWPAFNWTTVTNGIHLPRWQDSDFRRLDFSDIELWNLHMLKKRELVDTVVKRTGFGYDPEKLVISWARRLAEYKQPRSIFADLNKLKNMVTNHERPVQILFAGNSHSADPNAKSIIEEIIKIFASELAGSAIFIPNYNISLANHLVSGSDLWLNTPKGNLEACGTSGMKAISNGVLNCTVVDGWTHEVKWDGIGWTLNPKSVGESFYEILKNKIIPLYYDRNRNGIPEKWINRMRKSIDIANDFSAVKMVEQYQKKLYS
jgi:starch phosphorylase